MDNNKTPKVPSSRNFYEIWTIIKPGNDESNRKNANPLNIQHDWHFQVEERCLADSNRRSRFCRPLTKPLIQGTKLTGVNMRFPEKFCKVSVFLCFDKLFQHFFFKNQKKLTNFEFSSR